ncbi:MULTISPECIES: hypothetical protein [unclassified Sphingomonas]|uniref:hypothetical protein n=1 Tax=unclassified Sphingomonas TaxID=196159 RepID=UPI0012E39553|nr:MULTISPECIES: hypothetical protein [unclassified Sphingomonas]
MMLRFAACLLLVAGPAAWTPVVAQEISQADRAMIEARIAAFDAVIKAGRIGEVVDFLPPRLLHSMAGEAGLTEAELRPHIAAQMAEVFKVVKIVSFAMDIADASVATTPDGRRSYMLIPTEIVMELPDARRLRSRSSTIALKDDGQWYIVRIDNARQVIMLRDIYPEFAGVDFPAGSTAAVD